MDRNNYSPAPWTEQLEMNERDHGHHQVQIITRSLSSSQSLQKTPRQISQEEPLNGYSPPSAAFVDQTYNSQISSKGSTVTSFGNPWRTGFWVRLPVLGIASLIGVLICTVCALVVLVTSNGKVIETWGYGHQPSLYLAIISIISSLFMASALCQGLCIAFWRKALSGTSLKELHDNWRCGDSIPGAIKSTFSGSGRRNAIACLIVALSVIRAPLNQQASTVKSDVSFPTNGTVQLHIAQELPKGYAGITQVLRAESTLTAMLTPEFASVMQSYSTRAKIMLSDLTKNHTSSPCSDSCSLYIKAFGFKPKCTNIISLDDFMPLVNGTAQLGNYTAFETGATVIVTPGQTDEPPYDEQYGNLGLNATFRPYAFSNEHQVHFCDLRGGIVSYPVTVSAGVVSLNLNEIAEHGNFTGFQSLDLTKPTTNHAYEVPQTVLGGFQFAAEYLFSSTAVYQYYGAVSTWSLSGPLANSYMDRYKVMDNSSTNEYGWTDPMFDMVSTMQEIAFRAAMKAAADNATLANGTQTATYVGTKQEVIYVTRYGYMIASAIMSLVGIVAVMPLYYGWWELGRNISMSPLEIARAFDAPLLRDADGNTTAEELARGLKTTRIKYGQLAEGEVIDGMTGNGFVSDRVEERVRLIIGHEDSILAPRQGWKYN